MGKKEITLESNLDHVTKTCNRVLGHQIKDYLKYKSYDQPPIFDFEKETVNILYDIVSNDTGNIIAKCNLTYPEVDIARQNEKFKAGDHDSTIVKLKITYFDVNTPLIKKEFDGKTIEDYILDKQGGNGGVLTTKNYDLSKLKVINN